VSAGANLTLFWAFWILVWGVPAALIAQDRGRPPLAYFIAGLFFGPATLVFLLTRARTFDAEVRRQAEQGRHRCPQCGSFVYRDAFVCPHCQGDLSELRAMLDLNELSTMTDRA
jgi:hypothetical protein